MSKRKRRRKREKRKEKRPAAQQSHDLKPVHIITYEITAEPINHHLPRPIRKTVRRLHDESQSQPHKAIPELIDLIEKYPNVPVLYNYLSVAYSRTGQREKTEEIARENYRRNPDYLFARLNYAELCLAAGDYEQVAEIFEHKFDLKLLYPERKRFHISEAANFMGLVGVYFLETGERELAERYYEILEEIAPDFPVTKMLYSKLYPSFIKRLLNRKSGKSGG